MTYSAMFAYTFDSDLGLGGMLAKLNQVGPWEWVEWNNDRYGMYICAVPRREPRQSRVKILVDDDVDRFAVNAVLYGDDKATVDEVERTLLDRVLPAIGARDLKPTDTYE
jgi:hypothetical protein